MPHYRPRVPKVTASGRARTVATVVVILVVGGLAVWSGAIDTLNAARLFGSKP